MHVEPHARVGAEGSEAGGGVSAPAGRRTREPRTPGPHRRPRFLLPALLFFFLLAGSPPLRSAPSASAEEDRREPHLHPQGRVVPCRACPEPDDAWFRWEMGPFFRDGGAYRDTYETDGGECMAKPLAVKVSIEGYVWEPAGEGLVQDCPSGRYGYELNVRLGPDPRFDWQVDAEQTQGLDAGRTLGVEAAADAASPAVAGRGVTLSLTQRLEAAHCHRMRWAAAFLLARLRAKADYAVEKRWRWWIKNPNWGYQVLYSGDTWRPCENAHVELTRLAPVSIHLATRDGACPDAECSPVTVSESEGFMPKPPDDAPPFHPLRSTTVTEAPPPPPPTEPPSSPTTPSAEPTRGAEVPASGTDAEGDAPPCSPYPTQGVGAAPEPDAAPELAPPGTPVPSEPPGAPTAPVPGTGAMGGGAP